jgi:hypothetical protein
VDLTESIPLAHAGLTAGRGRDRERIVHALQEADVVGVHGEPEVGVTRVTTDALRQQPRAVIRVDLDGVSDDRDIAWLLARGLARALVPAADFSLLHGPIGLQPTSTRSAVLHLRSELGDAIAELAQGDSPPASTVTSGDVLAALERLVADEALPLVLWIDHLQTPGLTPRHPVDARQLLWDVRAVHQRTDLQVVVSCNGAATELAAGRESAFHGDGLWVTVGRPGTDAWQHVVEALRLEVGAEWVRDLGEITQQHPLTTLLALALRATRQEPVSALALWQAMLPMDDGHTARAVQHARTLHRLGARILTQIAHGMGPYQDPAGATTQDIHRAVRRLHQAGLIFQPAPRAWAVTNPLVAGRLRGPMPLTGRDARGVEALEVV